MIINYYGHSCFKLRSTEGTVVTDPYAAYVGFELPSLSADVVTVSHDGPGHNNTEAIANTARRDHPFIIDYPGEYEVEGISVFAVKTYQDTEKGSVRGENIVYTFLIDGLRVCHLGNLGHTLDEKTVAEIGLVDILFVPVGGEMTIDPKKAIKVAYSLDPNIVIPMHYKTDRHNDKVFADLATLDEFIKVYEAEPEVVDKLNVSRSSLPEEMELMVLKEQ